MVEQSFTNRYIDEQKLLALLRARFPRKTYTVQIKMGIWYITAPQALTQDEIVSCTTQPPDEDDPSS